MREAELTIAESMTAGGFVRRQGWFKAPGHRAAHLWFDLPAAVRPWITDSADPFVRAFLFVAMRRGLTVRVRGRVSPSLLGNLDTFMENWQAWRPRDYRAVRFVADDPGEDGGAQPAGDRAAIVAFSGGLDSSCTVWRHIRREAEGQTRRIEAGLFVHGFDIPLSARNSYEAACRRNEETLASIGLKLIPLATNYRALDADWRDSHGAALAACLSLFSVRFGAGLIGSSAPRSVALTAYGSLPATDPLLSSRAFEIVHDGADLNRVAKARVVAGWPLALRNLRVCWEGGAGSGNCGVCEKCIRTILELRVAGAACPPAFPSDVSNAQIEQLHLDEAYRRRIFARLLSEAEAAGLGGADWVSALRGSLSRASGNGLASRLREWRRRSPSLAPLRAICRRVRGF